MSLPRLIDDLWLAYLVVWWTWGLFNKRANHSVSWRGRAWSLRLAVILAVTGLIVLEHSWVAAHPAVRSWLEAHRPGPAAQWAGLALCAAGFAFAVWARVYLGGNWGIPMSMRQNHELVTSGPYARVRHPIYSGLLLAALGTGLADGPMLLPVLALFIVFFVFSARTEERMLREQFPQAYPSYQARTRMLIPFVL